MECVEAVLERLRNLGLKPGDNVAIFSVGATLIDLGFDPEAVLDAVRLLDAQKVVQVMPGNLILLLKPL